MADIHDAVMPLAEAMRRLREEGVDRVVTLGDAFDSYRPGEPAAGVARILAEAGAPGVWGNHDVGLSHEVSDRLQATADPALLHYAAQLQPHLVLDGHRFSHVLPWRDAHSLVDLWTFDDLTDVEPVRRCFASFPERITFVGHYHRWEVLGNDGALDWQGHAPITLAPPDRYLVVVAAVRDGWCALYDSERCCLTPIRC